MPIYDVFARKEYPEPLTYIGSIEADSDDAAIEGSLKKFGPESEWIEMLAVPQQEIITVFSASKEEK